jgi:hypothetical protein
MIRSSAASNATCRLRKWSADVTRPVIAGSFECESQHSHRDVGARISTGGDLAV